MGDCRILEDYLSVRDPADENYIPYGFIVHDNVLYLPNINIAQFMKPLEEETIKELPVNRYQKMSRHYMANVPPRDALQENIIAFSTGVHPYQDMRDAHQVAIVSKPGSGKTFSTAYSITDLNQKALIITHMTKIKNQWIDTFTDKFDYPKDKLMELSSGNLEDASKGEDFGKDVYFVNHQTIDRFISNMSPTQLNKAMISLGIGVKVIDEYHLHFRNSLVIDMFTNVNKTIYLTATFDRSDKQESILFSRITGGIPTYGASALPEEDEKHVTYHPVHYSTKCPYRVVKSLGSGFGMGMKKWVFADWTFFDDPDNNTNKIIFSIIAKCLTREGRILVTTPAIKSCLHLGNVIQNMYPHLRVGVISSKNTDKKNEEVKETCHIIVSTIQSAGTGVDIKGLRYVINAEPFSSKVTAEQFMGRLRPFFGSDGDQKVTYLFDLVDKSIIFCTAYFNGRSKRIKMLAKETIPLEM
jgi:superfamily II DNA or RNA helicase